MNNNLLKPSDFKSLSYRKIKILEKKLAEAESKLTIQTQINEEKFIDNYIKDMDKLHEKEWEIILNKIDFMTMMYENAFQMGGYNLTIFGDFLRHMNEPRSRTKTEHLKEIEKLKNSTIDMCITHNSISMIIDLEDYISRLIQFGTINEVKIEKNVEIVDGLSKTHNIIFSAKFKKCIININMFNNLSEHFFEHDDYDVNFLEINNSSSLRTRYKNNYERSNFEVLKTLVNIQRKKAIPLFYKINLSSKDDINVSFKLLKRQHEMKQNGYELTSTINCNESPDSECGVCREDISEDTCLSVCECTKSNQTLCHSCIHRIVEHGKPICPFCRSPMIMSLVVNKTENLVLFPKKETLIVRQPQQLIQLEQAIEEWHPRNEQRLQESMLIRESMWPPMSDQEWTRYQHARNPDNDIIRGIQEIN